MHVLEKCIFFSDTGGHRSLRFCIDFFCTIIYIDVLWDAILVANLDFGQFLGHIFGRFIMLLNWHPEFWVKIEDDKLCAGNPGKGACQGLCLLLL